MLRRLRCVQIFLKLVRSRSSVVSVCVCGSSSPRDHRWHRPYKTKPNPELDTASEAEAWAETATEGGRRFMAAWRKEEVDAAGYRQEKR